MVELLDIVRPGVSLVDRAGESWSYSGELTPSPEAAVRANAKASIDNRVSPKWSNCWRRDCDGELRTIESVHADFGPLTVVLGNWSPRSVWYSRTSTFGGNRDSVSELLRDLQVAAASES